MVARMTTRSTLRNVTIAAAVILSACGGDDEVAATSDDSTTADGGAGTTIETPVATTLETAVEEPASDEETGAAAETDEGCDQLLTAEELESILGAPVEVEPRGTGQICNWVFASDAIGTMQVFTGSKADEAMDTLIPKYEAEATSRGILLDDGRGYVLNGSAVVRSDSGRVFSLAVPDGIDVADMNAALKAITDLLLTR